MGAAGASVVKVSSAILFVRDQPEGSASAQKGIEYYFALKVHELWGKAVREIAGQFPQFVLRGPLLSSSDQPD